MSQVGQTLLIRVPGKDPEVMRLDGEGPFPLGRSVDNRIVVNDTAVSRQHARLTVKDDAFWIEDLGSKNGTKVNGTLLDAPSG